MLKLVNESDKRGKFSLLAVLLPTFKQENSINLHITFLVRKMTTYISWCIMYNEISTKLFCFL